MRGIHERTYEIALSKKMRGGSMIKKLLPVAALTIIFLIMLAKGQALSHVPYFEREDFTEEQPFKVPKSIEQSIAVYAWLEFEGGINSYSDDIDVYTFELTEPTRIFAESLVPLCQAYENFLPWFAVTGPGLPEPEISLPFYLPPGYGAVVVKNYEPGEERPTFYEPFGAKSYYRGPGFDETLEEPGIYRIYFWDPYQKGGDYVAVLGYEETWDFDDIIRALIYTPMIRRGQELHVECN